MFLPNPLAGLQIDELKQHLYHAFNALPSNFALQPAAATTTTTTTSTSLSSPSPKSGRRLKV
jgi:hypothetical protein